MIKRYMFLIIFCFAVCIGCSESKNNENINPIEVNMKSDTDTTEKVDVEIEYVNMKALSKSDYSYITSKNDDIIIDDLNNQVPEFMDVVSFRKVIDDKNIYFYLEMKDIPDTFVINQEGLYSNIMEYCWRINFDTNLDESIAYDTTISHEKFWESGKNMATVTIEDDSFNNIVWQHGVNTGYVISDFSFDVDNYTLIYHVEKGNDDNLLRINEDTPFYILIEYNNEDYYLYEMIPK